VCQRIFVCTHDDRVAVRYTRPADDPAGLTLREPVILPCPCNRLPARSGLTSFPKRYP
jgi:hypothetical protein